MASTLTATTTDVLANSSLMVENKVCPGCKKTVVTEDGSVVVAFGCVTFIMCFDFKLSNLAVNRYSTSTALNAQSATTK